MKLARPRMLAHLKIIWQFHAHPVHQKVLRFFGPRYIGDDLFLGTNLISFNRAVVPLLEFNFQVREHSWPCQFRIKYQLQIPTNRLRPINSLATQQLFSLWFWSPRCFKSAYKHSNLIQSSCRSFIGVIVPYEISKVNFHVETKILVSMSEEIK
jgi:hypothetical protein